MAVNRRTYTSIKKWFRFPTQTGTTKKATLSRIWAVIGGNFSLENVTFQKFLFVLIDPVTFKVACLFLTPSPVPYMTICNAVFPWKCSRQTLWNKYILPSLVPTQCFPDRFATRSSHAVFPTDELSSRRFDLWSSDTQIDSPMWYFEIKIRVAK